jgi:hypothetical protein
MVGVAFDIPALKTEYFQESDQIERATKTSCEMLRLSENPFFNPTFFAFGF